METIVKFSGAIAPRLPLERRSVERLLAPLEAVAETSPHFISKSLGRFESGGFSYALPRFIYLGPKGGGETIRIGLLATIQGDEPEGALALTRFVEVIESNREISKGYALFLYPVCNPTGFEDNTSHSRNGKNLDQEFWKNTSEPEVRYLQSEIWMHAFDGIITLRSDATADGLYGHAAGAVLSEHLLEPALREAEHFIPRSRRPAIDLLPAKCGIIKEGNSAVLKSPAGLRRPPFEIVLQTPQSAPLHRQAEAFVTALRTMLVEYRYLIAIAQNI
jgi:murein peptide amidase A